jgi:hypothetical protein
VSLYKVKGSGNGRQLIQLPRGGQQNPQSHQISEMLQDMIMEGQNAGITTPGETSGPEIQVYPFQEISDH